MCVCVCVCVCAAGCSPASSCHRPFIKKSACPGKGNSLPHLLTVLIRNTAKRNNKNYLILTYFFLFLLPFTAFHAPIKVTVFFSGPLVFFLFFLVYLPHFYFNFFFFFVTNRVFLPGTASQSASRWCLRVCTMKTPTQQHTTTHHSTTQHSATLLLYFTVTFVQPPWRVCKHCAHTVTDADIFTRYL